MAKKEKNSLEKFIDTLSKEEKSLLSTYLTCRTFESLSKKYDEILKKSHENKKTNN